MGNVDLNSNLARTPLYDLHLELGARMVPFAGYEMPVQYPDGVMKEHLHTRDQAGLFDVSHMGQVRIHGERAAATLETLVPVDVLGLAANRQRYALFTNEAGGILDDFMVTNAGDHLFVVVNAACKEQDLAHMETHIGNDCRIQRLADRGLIAIQGPGSAAVMSRIAPGTRDLIFMTAAALDVAGIPCYVARSGYTGEDGFEISVPGDRAEALARALLEQPEVMPVGLGARDSLRLEAGLCLYGHDIDTTTSPVEASLMWALQKVRRPGGARAGGYPGAEVIAEQLVNGVSRRRVGLLPQTKAPVREGAEIVNPGGRSVGRVTSGGFGPTVGGPIAMGYVESEYSALDTKLEALVRSKPQPVVVAKTPFVSQRYYRG